MRSVQTNPVTSKSSKSLNARFAAMLHTLNDRERVCLWGRLMVAADPGKLQKFCLETM